MLPSPWWFSAVDLLLAYLPGAWCGHALASALMVALVAPPVAAALFAVALRAATQASGEPMVTGLGSPLMLASGAASGG